MRPRLRVAAASSRPSGTDGADYPFRMTVDNRYKKAAERKFQLQKLLIAQAALYLVKATTVMLMAAKGEYISGMIIASCTLGGAAVLSGTVGTRRSSSRYLYVFLFTTSAAVMLSSAPFLSGRYYSKISKSFERNIAEENYRQLLIDGLEAAQELIGMIVQSLEILVTFSLLHYLLRKRS